MNSREKYKAIYEEIRSYYEDKFQQYGDTAKGVDWSSEESQTLRFEQLTQILPKDKDKEFTLLDYGAGYGALYPFVKKLWKNCRYTGYDISKELIKRASQKFPDGEWLFEIPQETQFDYVISSGIFNVRPGIPWLLWKAHIEAELEFINGLTRKGFSFNMLTSYSDALKVRDHLYYGDPCYYFHLCKTKYGQWVSLKHDYPLYEFSILVFKEL